ncbi:MAG: hypothetical protein J5494_01325, partial [Candidatus Methanomethylophilaceae archaeon]|nr:hypothetical protein [Candidatus Methanomethylophilaceae archaeon]
LLREAIDGLKDYSPGEISGWIRPSGEGSLLPSAARESFSIRNGPLRYDSLFLVDIPGKRSILVNLEIQGRHRPGYSLIKRELYQAARIISDEKNVFFEDSDFDKLLPVYSIWINISPPEELQNTVAKIRLEGCLETGGGEVPYQTDPDLNIIEIRAGDPREARGSRLLMICGSAFFRGLSGEERKLFLNNFFNIDIDEQLRECLKVMTATLDEEYRSGLIEQGIEKGIEEGMERGITEGRIAGYRESVLNIMKSAGWSAEKAAEMIGVPAELYEKVMSEVRAASPQ